MRARDLTSAEHPAAAAASIASFIGTLAGVLVLIGALLAFDVFLTQVDQRESSHHAQSEYESGIALLASNEPLRAADRFEAALAIERENVNFGLALGEAQRRAGDTSKAEATLSGLLRRAENDGAINLAMAHVLADEGRVTEAKSYFHRAIYGHWGADSLARRVDARFALIELLAGHGGGSDLLAELLPFEDVPRDSVALRERLGRWFLLASSPTRAANMFREVLRRDPDNGAAFAGLGEAALAQGNFRTARADFARASALLPADTTITPRLAFADTLLASDPTASGLDAAQRVERSRALIAAMLVTLDGCVDRNPRAVGGAARAAIADSAGGSRASIEIADSLTTLASDLWLAYSPLCPSIDADRRLQLLGVRLSQ